ncbi:BON domain-containing protein [Agrobacterium rhizogenes]|nr:BON domain-containing protein [Rhizobium rhizogenes]NTH85781.1 BON domain-containing protein [Rhizobium rhizogenes]NTI76632.1 BON domain-containing protein [Rhizobium rhizogenes]
MEPNVVFLVGICESKPMEGVMQDRPKEQGTSQQRPDAEIRQEIHERLDEDPLLDAGGIFISVIGGCVLIEGSVENNEAKHRAETHSRQVSGISGHDSNLCIRKPQ